MNKDLQIEILHKQNNFIANFAICVVILVFVLFIASLFMFVLAEGKDGDFSFASYVKDTKAAFLPWTD